MGRELLNRSQKSPSARSGQNFASSEILVRKEGFEPPRPFGHKILSLARLPVPPLPQWWLYSTGLRRTAPMGFWGALGLKMERTREVCPQRSDVKRGDLAGIGAQRCCAPNKSPVNRLQISRRRRAGPVGFAQGKQSSPLHGLRDKTRSHNRL